MKSKLYIAAALLTVAIIVSCGGNTDKEVVDKSIIPAGSDTTPVQTVVTSPTVPAQVTIPGTAAPAAGTTVIPGNVNIPAGTTLPQTVTMNPQNNAVITNPQMITQTAAQTATAPGMNPPHGQPGHRCDISVGAPLNSKPAPVQPTTVSTVPQQPQVTMKEVPTPTKTLPGMNPPHGEPNHRCDIAVGAPLNSKPAAPAANPVQVMAPPALLTPAKSDSTKN